MRAQVLKRNNVKVLGSGSQVMLFAHGFGCDQNMWRFITPHFMQTYRVVLFDYTGCGQSDLRAYTLERYKTLDGYAADLLDICAELDLKDAVLVAHSVSTMIGVLAANKEPHRFARLLMVGPSPCYYNDPPDYFGGFERQELVDMLSLMEKNYIGWAQFLAPVVMKNADHPELTLELQDSFCSTDPVVTRRFAEATFFSDYRSELRKVQVPSLIMQCSEDAIAPAAVGEYVHRHTPGSTFRLMRATGHCPHMSHPSETIEVISDYLRL